MNILVLLEGTNNDNSNMATVWLAYHHPLFTQPKLRDKVKPSLSCSLFYFSLTPSSFSELFSKDPAPYDLLIFIFGNLSLSSITKWYLWYHGEPPTGGATDHRNGFWGEAAQWAGLQART